MTRVRPLDPADEPEWRRLWRDYLAFYGTTLHDAIYEATFRRLLDPAEPMRALMAERDGRLVGLAHMILHRHCWTDRDVCYLQDLFVERETRGGGVGRALIEAVFRAADETGAGAVYWLTQEDNYVGRMLYDRVGERTPFIKYRRV